MLARPSFSAMKGLSFIEGPNALPRTPCARRSFACHNWRTWRTIKASSTGAYTPSAVWRRRSVRAFFTSFSLTASIIANDDTSGSPENTAASSALPMRFSAV